jgi:hypothetical protein
MVLSLRSEVRFVAVTYLQQIANIPQTTATLSQARYFLASTSSDELVRFGGGYNATRTTSCIILSVFSLLL